MLAVMTKRFVWLAVAMLGCGGDDGVAVDAPLGDAPAGVDAPIDALPPVAAPDIRLKWTDAFLPGYKIVSESGGAGEISETVVPVAPAIIGTPANSTSVFLFYGSYRPVDPVASYGENYALPDHQADLDELAGSAVLTSLDLSNGQFIATAMSSSAQADSAPTVGTSTPESLNADVAADAAAGRIATAVAADGSGSDILVYSYSRSDQATPYESVAVIAAEADVGEVASQLAGSGYALTAFGKASSTDRTYALVGTRLTAGSDPLGMLVVYDEFAEGIPGALDEGFVPVGAYFAADGTQVWLFEF
jgi:hypothetical protein